MTTAPHTLVLTATGKVGSRVLTRDTWRPALDGITSVYIAYYPDLAAPGAAEVVEEFAGLAVANGARRLVLLSGRGETEAERGELAEIAEAAGREIRYTPVTSEEYSTALAGLGVPSDAIGLLTYLFDEVLDGRNASLTDGVERALGRAPRDFTDYVRAAAAAGVWRV
ncbi:hypothetical protein [Rhodococcus opacus]|uniref:hypothetical protein n=1 Tax=Rhodococcus opacus TaxID=37919 RepID=UPI001C477C5B|nr:hypothetical protein [Rhodococcus opacus]MBV6755586.1 hypothetical protein [Rhodococcus opacus]